MDGKGRAASVGSGQRAGGERRKCEANVGSAGGERERRAASALLWTSTAGVYGQEKGIRCCSMVEFG